MLKYKPAFYFNEMWYFQLTPLPIIVPDFLKIREILQSLVTLQHIYSTDNVQCALFKVMLIAFGCSE